MKHNNFIKVLAIVLAIVSMDCNLLEAQSWPAIVGNNETLRSPASQKGDVVVPHTIRTIKLEDVSFYVKGGSQPDANVRFSPDGTRIAIGTFLGQIVVTDIYTGNVLLKKKIAEGLIKHLDFSPDGKTLYFGEQSVDAFVIAMDIKSGEILWKYRMANDLKTSPPPAKDDLWGIYRLPGCYRLKTLNNGDILVLGIHSWGDIRDIHGMNRLSRIYRFSPKGKLKWSFPKHEGMPLSMIYMDSDSAGRRIAILTGYSGKNCPTNYEYKPGSLLVLNGKNGFLAGKHIFKPFQPHFQMIGFWQSISVNPLGNMASIGMRDGRTFVFNLDDVTPIKVFYFGTPIMISNVPVSASATYTHLAADGSVYFQTGNSSVPHLNSMQTVVAPPGPHPNANTINVVDEKGDIMWRFKSGHVYQNFWTSMDGRWVLTSVKKEDPVTGRESGAMLFDTHRPGGGSSKIVFYYQVKGISFFHADIARDGSAFAIIEVPYKDPKTGKLVGTYQVHVVR